MKQLSIKIEQISVFLAILTITLLGFNFVTFNHLDKRYEPGFLVNSVLLLFVTIYLRFFIKYVSSLHRVFYRIAIVFLIWSTGLFFFPFMENILYLITIPGFYFFIRVELKGDSSQYEDIIAATISLLFAALIYSQHQPLKIFFYADSFNWESYFIKSHLLIIIAPCLMRLHKKNGWKGLPIFATTLFITGVTLTLYFLIKKSVLSGFEQYSYLLVAHITLSIMLTNNTVSEFIYNFTGLKEPDIKRYKTQLFIFINIFLQINILYLYYIITFTKVSIPIIYIFISTGLAGLLYHRRDKSVEILLTEFALISFPINFYILKDISFYIFIPLSIVLLFYTLIKVKKIYQFQNISLYLIFSAFIGALFHFNFLTPFGLAGILFPLICWFMLPDKPVSISEKYIWIMWPILTGISVICLTTVSYQSLSLWALSCITPLPLIYILLNNKIIKIKTATIIPVKSFIEAKEFILFNMSIFSSILCIISFSLFNEFYIYEWTNPILVIAVFLFSASINLYYTIKLNKIKYAIFTETYIWLAILVFRWKLDVLDHLNFGSPLDGYFLIVFAIILAGVREIVRDKNPIFITYFQRTTLIYGIAGWLYMISLQFFFPIKGMNFHGETASILMALLNFILAKTVNKRNLIFGFIFGNLALIILFLNQSVFNPIFYIMPVVLSGLTLVQVFKDSLSETNVRNIRLTLSLIMFGCVAFYNINDFNQSVFYPLTAAILSTLGVVCGISLKVRIYLYLGTVFFFVNIFGVLTHVIVKQPPENTTLFIGIIFLVTGLTFIISFLVFQMKREEILEKYHDIRKTLTDWE